MLCFYSVKKSIKLNNIIQLKYHPLLCYFATKAEIYKACFELLEIPENSTQDTVREKYINLVKCVHPDSGHPEASTERFTKIDNAFRILLEKYAKERRGIYEDNVERTMKIFDIKHTAPQHRQYLNHSGVGQGVPSHREKEFQRARIEKAQEQVLDIRIENVYKTTSPESTSLLTERPNQQRGGSFYANHANKIKQGFDVIVEEQIQQAIRKGEFDNLPGSGKPLNDKSRENPYVDFIQYKFNKILLDNDFAPEWIILQKDIRTEINELKLKLKNIRQDIGPLPISDYEQMEWQQFLNQMKCCEKQINEKINNYNLIVPILNNQMLQINLENIANKILHNGKCSNENRLTKRPSSSSNQHRLNENISIFSIFSWFS